MLLALKQFFTSPSDWLRGAIERYPIRSRAMALEWSQASMMDIYDCKF